MSASVTKIVQFAAAHRLMHYDGACAHIHGHNYKMEATIETLSRANEVDTIGLLVDFKEVKEVLAVSILEVYDHKLILNENDPLIAPLGRAGVCNIVRFPGNPTAENMVETFRVRINDELLKRGLAMEVSRLRIWETDTSFAEGSWA